MMMLGAIAGIGLYIGMTNMSKNKNKLKKQMNDIIDDTAEMFD